MIQVDKKKLFTACFEALGSSYISSSSVIFADIAKQQGTHKEQVFMDYAVFITARPELHDLNMVLQVQLFYMFIFNGEYNSFLIHG